MGNIDKTRLAANLIVKLGYGNMWIHHIILLIFFMFKKFHYSLKKSPARTCLSKSSNTAQVTTAAI